VNVGHSSAVWCLSKWIKLIRRRLFFGYGACDIGDWTVFNATATASTKIGVYTAGPFFNPDLKISSRTLDRFNICIREYLDVEMPADLDQFG